MDGSLPKTTFALALLFSVAARAQDAQGPTFSLQSFRPAVDSKGFVTVNASPTLGHLDFSLGLIGNYSYRSLSLHQGGVDFSVDHLITAQLQAAIGLFGGPRWRDRMHGVSLQLGLSLPVNVMLGSRQPGFTDADPNHDTPLTFSGQSIGDVGLNLKARLLHHPLGLAVLLAVDFPSGNARQFLGEGQTTFRPTLILDKETRRFRVALNLGALVRPDKHSFTDRGTNLSVASMPLCVPVQADGACGTQLTRALGTQLTYSIGASFAVVPQRFDLIGELFGAADLTGGNSGHPLEVLAAAKVYLAQSSFFEIGAGAGALPARIVDGRGNMTGLPEVRVFIGFIFEPLIGDRDHDGIKDDVDQCPDEPGLAEFNGCPPPPPPPPPPPKPEPTPSPEGEPEPPRSLVARHKQVIVTFDKIYFKTASAEILPRSFPLLNDLVILLQGSTDIELVEVAGHADERGKADYNLLLTQERSQSVVRYLVEHGVDPLRLTAHGYGEEQPAFDERTQRPCKQHTERCWEMNRRVEFRILRQ